MNYEVMNIFLCCLGPTEEFVGDFWRMVWQKKCRKIVMLTRLVEHNKVSLGLVVFSRQFVALVFKQLLSSIAKFNFKVHFIKRDGDTHFKSCLPIPNVLLINDSI